MSHINVTISNCQTAQRFKLTLSTNIEVTIKCSVQVLEAVVGRLFCQRALWQRDPQRVTKFLLLSARDQFRKRMNEQGGLVRLNFSYIFVK